MLILAAKLTCNALTGDTQFKCRGRRLYDQRPRRPTIVVPWHHLILSLSTSVSAEIIHLSEELWLCCQGKMAS